MISLSVLPGNEQDLGHKNIVNTYSNTYTKYERCFGYQSANAQTSWYLSFWCFCLKLVSWMVNAWDTSFKQKSLLCIGRLVFKTDNIMHLAHLVKQVSVDYVFITKIIFTMHSISVYQNLVKSLPNLRQIFNKNLIQ